MRKGSLLFLVLFLFFIVVPAFAVKSYANVDLLNVSGHFQFHFKKKKLGIKSGFVSYTIQNLSETKLIKWVVFTKPINAKINFISDRSGKLKYKVKGSRVGVLLRRPLHYAWQVILSVGYSVNELTTKNKNIRQLKSSFINDETIMLSPFYWLVCPQVIHKTKISPFVKAKNLDMTLIFPASKYTFLPYGKVESKKVEKGKFIKYFYIKHKYVPFYRNLSLFLSRFKKKTAFKYKECKISLNLAKDDSKKYKALESFAKQGLDIINTNLSFLPRQKAISINEIGMKWDPKLIHFEGSSFGKNANYYTAKSSKFTQQKSTIIHEMLHCHLGNFNLYINFEEGLVKFMETYLMYGVLRNDSTQTILKHRHLVLVYKSLVSKINALRVLLKKGKISKKKFTSSIRAIYEKNNPVLLFRYYAQASFLRYVYNAIGTEKFFKLVNNFLEDKKPGKNMPAFLKLLKETHGAHFIDYYKYIASANVLNLLTVHKKGKDVLMRNNSKILLFFRVFQGGKNKESIKEELVSLKAGEERVFPIYSKKVRFLSIDYSWILVDKSYEDNYLKL